MNEKHYMCGRFTLKTDPAAISNLFHVEIPSQEILPRYNIAPYQMVAAVVGDKHRSWQFFRWGLIPRWAKDKSVGFKLINARGETAAHKPSFREAFRERRCLVLADGFYEWEKTENGKQPFYFSMADGSVMAFAGLWEHWGKETAIDSCTILTTTANQLVSPCHDRMPVILDPEAVDAWLSGGFNQPKLQSLLAPFSAVEMVRRKVNKTVNNARNETPECLARVEH